ncbi:MAG: hypothetical protein K2X65_06415 [Burkholderiaceae bacterium]|nr:hypothetical protein [Burkholderiaceae bacterium]
MAQPFLSDDTSSPYRRNASANVRTSPALPLAMARISVVRMAAHSAAWRLVGKVILAR